MSLLLVRQKSGHGTSPILQVQRMLPPTVGYVLGTDLKCSELLQKKACSCPMGSCDPREADRDTIVRNIIDGQYDRPLRVIALNPEEGWSRDVSEEIAKAVLAAASVDDRVLTAGRVHSSRHSAYAPSQRD
jgi:hypothetical protein